MDRKSKCLKHNIFMYTIASLVITFYFLNNEVYQLFFNGGPLTSMSAERKREVEALRLEKERNAARMAEISASVKNCDEKGSSWNRLCATPETALKYAHIEYISSVRNPCVCLSDEPDNPMGPHISKWVSSVNILK